MIVALDARYGLMNERRGIGVATYHFLQVLRDLEPSGFEFVALADSRLDLRLASEFRDSAVKVVPLAVSPFAAWEQVAFPRAAARYQANLCHALANVGPLLSSIPMVVTVHDVIEWHRGTDFPGTLTLRHRASRAYRMRAMGKNVKDAVAIHTPSHYSAEDIQRTLRVPSRKIRVIPLGFALRDTGEDDDILKELRLGQRSYALAFGALDPRKNTELLLQLWASTEMPWDLVVVGLEPPALQRWRRQYGSVSRIHLRGFEADARIRSLLRDAAAFLYPSHYEGFGLPVLEAMSMGIPVILGQGTVGEEVARGEALAADVRRVSSWIDDIRRLATDKPFWRSRSDAGRAVAATYSWDNTARGLLDLYREVV